MTVLGFIIKEGDNFNPLLLTSHEIARENTCDGIVGAKEIDVTNSVTWVDMWWDDVEY